MKLGEIYRANWDDSLMRIIGFDSFEVFYDGYWKHDGSWTFASNLKKKCSFYRTSINVFTEKAELIDFKELTEEELFVFRPDLTIRTCRIKDTTWTDNNLEKLALNGQLLNIETIKTSKIWLYPFGPNGGLKKGELITSKNSMDFSINELLNSAKRIQQSVNQNETNGIGIYRTGVQKQIPSYYIGEYFDSAGIMKS